MTNNQKVRVAILFGGKSGEHEVSISSAVSVFNALDKSKFEVTLIGIDKSGRWTRPSEAKILANSENPRLIKLNQEKESITLIPYQNEVQIVSLDGPTSPHHFDVIMPILHGPHGEDGTLQGLLELSNIPYVGSGVIGSALGMDKELSRKLFQLEGIPVVPTLVVRKHEYFRDKNHFVNLLIEKLGLPLFVKPANMGSSVGVHKIKTKDEALAKIDNAFQFDTKILAEKFIPARELECSVLGNFEPKASIVGEIIPQHEFYSYEAKYIDENGALLEIPAKNLSAELISQIQDYSIRAFKAIECRGMARVDFFLDRVTGKLYLNEINTIPGFTKISMYPKLWAASGIAYSQLLEHLIQLAFEHHKEKNSLQTSFISDET